MGFDVNNDYGITRKEWKAFKKEMKAEAKENGNVEFSKADAKEIKAAIKSGDLGAYLDRVGQDMQGVMGLHLQGKVDGTEDLKAAYKTFLEANFATAPDGKPVDKAKVIGYILKADAKRVAKETNTFVSTVDQLDMGNKMAESPFMEALNKEFGIS